MSRMEDTKRLQEWKQRVAVAEAKVSVLQTLLVEQTGQYERLRAIYNDCVVTVKTKGTVTPSETTKPEPRRATKPERKVVKQRQSAPAQDRHDPDASAAVAGAIGGVVGGMISGGGRGRSGTVGGGTRTQRGGRSGGGSGSCAGGQCGSPGGLGGGGFTISDIRVKRDIFEVGRLANGLGLYSYRYDGSYQYYVGVMGHEVAKINHAAVRRGPDGYLRVNYQRLGLKEMTWDEWRASPRQSGATLISFGSTYCDQRQQTLALTFSKLSSRDAHVCSGSQPE